MALHVSIVAEIILQGDPEGMCAGVDDLVPFASIVFPLVFFKSLDYRGADLLPLCYWLSDGYGRVSRSLKAYLCP